MPRTRECDYCGADIEPGTGTMFVRNNGSTVHFCSSKCENNADLGREARNLEWTESGRAAGGRSEEAAPAETDADVQVEDEETELAEDDAAETQAADDAVESGDADDVDEAVADEDADEEDETEAEA